ncbi:MAG: hypothetical protein MI974_19060 [Chitinophagales bacterium]|nr:hypothetical protein [Chitinophagales bacterium]
MKMQDSQTIPHVLNSETGLTKKCFNDSLNSLEKSSCDVSDQRITQNAVGSLSLSADESSLHPYSITGVNFTDGQLVRLPFKKALKTIDWLSLWCRVSASSPLLSGIGSGAHSFGDFDEWGIDIRDYGSRHMENHGVVYFSGEEIATIEWGERRGSVTDTDTAVHAMVKFNNRLFYESANLYDTVSSYLDAIGLACVHVSRVDLALDGLNLSGLFDSYFSGQLKKKGRGNIQGHYSNFDATWQGFSCGRRSYRYFRYYNKSKELNRSETKYYIGQWHEKNFEPSGLEEDVFRLEVELHREYLKNCDFDLEDLLNLGETFDNLYLAASKNYFEFVRRGDSNMSRAKVLFSIGDILSYAKGKVDKIRAKFRDGVHTAKMALKKLYQVGCETGGASVRPAIRAILSRHPLRDWFVGKTKYWASQMDAMSVILNRTFDSRFQADPFSNHLPLDTRVRSSHGIGFADFMMAASCSLSPFQVRVLPYKV